MPGETDHELTFAEKLVMHSIGVLVFLVLFRFIALKGMTLMGLQGDFGEASRLEMLVALWLVGIVIHFTLPDTPPAS